MHFLKSLLKKNETTTEIVMLCRESRPRVEELIIMEMACIIGLVWDEAS